MLINIGLFKNVQKNSLIIDCSTISPIVAKELNEAGKKAGVTYVDAPVSGGVAGA
jgi:3-hydroxyisobutyrate dehydrogenase